LRQFTGSKKLWINILNIAQTPNLSQPGVCDDWYSASTVGLQ